MLKFVSLPLLSIVLAVSACTHALEDDAVAESAGTAATPLAFKCSGSEPFWSLEISDEMAMLRRPGDTEIPSTELMDIQGGWVDDDLSDGVVAWQGHGLELAISEAACRSEADEDHAFRIDLGALFPRSSSAPGCCSRK